jgi:hypothetical protein
MSRARGGVGNRHPGEVAEFDQLGRLWILGRQLRQGRVERDQVVARVRGRGGRLGAVQSDALAIPAVFLAPVSPGGVD